MDVYFRVRGLVPIPAYLPLLLVSWKEFRNPWVTWPAGAALVLLGFWLRLSSVRHLGKSVRSPKPVARRMVVTGPYAWLRNPVYAATLLIALGFAALSKLLWYAPALFGFLLVHYTLVIRAEEAKLEELYGEEYRAYARRVPRWIPRPPKEPGAGEPEAWGAVWRREWKLAAALAAAAGLMAAKGLVRGIGA